MHGRKQQLKSEFYPVSAREKQKNIRYFVGHEVILYCAYLSGGDIVSRRVHGSQSLSIEILDGFLEAVS